jgi:hypothetical protein
VTAASCTRNPGQRIVFIENGPRVG